jgi:dolichol kinase
MIAVIVRSLDYPDAASLLCAALAAGLIVSEAMVRGVRFPVLSWFIRKYERNGNRPGKGVLTFVIGSLLALVLYKNEIAFAAILILAFEDSFSTVFGKLYGKTKLRMNKTLEGAAAGFLACFSASLMVLPPRIAFIACIFATAVEFFAVIDDNILIPIVTGGIMYMLL